MINIKHERILIFAAQIKYKDMNRVEFKTVVHNGIIEIPKENPEVKDKEVKVILMWEDKPVEEKCKKTSPMKRKVKSKKEKKELTEFQKYLLTWPEMTDEEYEYVQEKRRHFNEWK